jgi:hypothetical protein
VLFSFDNNSFLLYGTWNFLLTSVMLHLNSPPNGNLAYLNLSKFAVQKNVLATEVPKGRQPSRKAGLDGLLFWTI